jgi:hypothetical protein
MARGPGRPRKPRRDIPFHLRDPERARAHWRAVSSAKQRLAELHRAEYQRLLREAKVAEGLQPRLMPDEAAS